MCEKKRRDHLIFRRKCFPARAQELASSSLIGCRTTAAATARRQPVDGILVRSTAGYRLGQARL